MARSGSAVMSEAIDTVRSGGVGLDGFVHRWVDRILRRGTDGHPGAPPASVLPPELPLAPPEEP
jgi:hypothetical protein